MKNLKVEMWRDIVGEETNFQTPPPIVREYIVPIIARTTIKNLLDNIGQDHTIIIINKSRLTFLPFMVNKM